MAYADNTLNGIIQLNDANVAEIGVTDLLQDAPLLAAMVAVKASNGTQHKYLKETVAAGAAFLAVNAGVANASGQEELVTNTLTYLDGSFYRDIAIADAFGKGRGAYMEKETQKALRAMMAGLEKQILQSTGSDAAGFSGLTSNTLVDGLTDGMVINAGGAGKRSCWLLRTTESDCAVIAGNDGVIKFDFDPDVLMRILTDVATGAGYNALSAALGGWFGLQFGSAYSVGRIANLDSTTNHTLSDAWISKAIACFPATRQPNLIVMDRVLLQELQASRTATNPTGAPAPFPTESFGIKIVVSDHGAITESAMTTTTTSTTTTTTTT